jgi:hypothetical protein
MWFGKAQGAVACGTQQTQIDVRLVFYLPTCAVQAGRFIFGKEAS